MTSPGMPFIAEAEFPNAYGSVAEATGEYGSVYLLRNVERWCATN